MAFELRFALELFDYAVIEIADQHLSHVPAPNVANKIATEKRPQ